MLASPTIILPFFDLLFFPMGLHYALSGFLSAYFLLSVCRVATVYPVYLSLFWSLPLLTLAYNSFTNISFIENMHRQPKSKSSKFYFFSLLYTMYVNYTACSKQCFLFFTKKFSLIFFSYFDFSRNAVQY